MLKNIWKKFRKFWTDLFSGEFSDFDELDKEIKENFQRFQIDMSSLFEELDEVERLLRGSKVYGVNRTVLSLALESLRKGICAYGPGSKTCDCKFSTDGEFHNGIGLQARGEQTGCPELRTALALIDNMTDEEYEILFKRAQLTLIG